MLVEEPSLPQKKREQLNIRPSPEALRYFLGLEARIEAQWRELNPNWRRRIKHPETFDVLMTQCQDVEQNGGWPVIKGVLDEVHKLGGLIKIREAMKEQEEK